MTLERRRLAWTAALMVMAVAALAAALRSEGTPAAEKPAAPANAILISWDGLDRSVLKELLGANKLPNLAALIKDGSLQDIEVTGHPTVTAPGHAEMLTGLDVARTGVVDDTIYQAIPEGLTIFERVQKQLGADAVQTIMVTSKGGYMDGANADEPYWFAKKHVTFFQSKGALAPETGQTCLDALGKHHDPRFLAFFHFRDPDSAGHFRGMDSGAYRRAAMDCDEWLGKIVAWLQEGKLYDRTLVYVTADHGFDLHGFNHLKAPHSWLATNDKTVVRGGSHADIAATILTRFGVDVAKLQPRLIGSDLAVPVKKLEPAPVGAK